ncbi:hypothetical protein ACLI1A_16720 [Flavobacterium sp. RHBU_3]|uniref:hypothetical protein n=1 Tax=Flavobacterium sp. RHBU_3 TaxID=3391184 RepID=UPI003984870A
MKKIIFPLTFVGILLAVSCSDEDELPTQSYIGCQTCEVAGTAPNYTAEDYEACVGIVSSKVDSLTEAGTIVQVTVLDTFLFVNGANTGLKPDYYFSLYCDNAYDPDAISSGGSNGGTNGAENCVTCASYPLNGQTIPEMEICQGENGNAYVGGQDTGIIFNTYVATMQQATTCQ